MNKELERYIEREIILDTNILGCQHRTDSRSRRSAAFLSWLHITTRTPTWFTPSPPITTRVSQTAANGTTSTPDAFAADTELRRWFSEEQIAVMRDAVEDHRASSDGEPRTIYGRIVAEADRVIDPETIIRRTVQYGLAHCPELDREEQYARCLAHLQQKYAEGGYLRLWIAESENARRLEELRGVIRDSQRLRKMFDAAFDTETAE